ncbi:MAG: AAA family ATPase [Candidatus Dependentiae bacterium]|nr:AAA family ATPase [Candidatus Dependentiae bacterium]
MKRSIIALLRLFTITLSISCCATDDDLLEMMNKYAKNTDDKSVQPQQVYSDASDVEPGVKEILLDTMPPKLKRLFDEFKKRKGWEAKNRFKGCRPVVTLVGPPGTGKTCLAQVLAEELNAPFVMVNCSELGDKFQNSAEAGLATNIARARAINKSLGTDFAVVILDEIQSLTDDSVSGKEAPGRNLATLIDKVSKQGDILFVITANSTDKLPDMLQSRISGYCFTIDVPNDKNKERAARHYFRDEIAEGKIKPAQMSTIAKDCEGCSYRDITGISERIHLAMGKNRSATDAMIKEEMQEYHNDEKKIASGLLTYLPSGETIADVAKTGVKAGVAGGAGWAGATGTAYVWTTYVSPYAVPAVKWLAAACWTTATGTPPPVA